MIKGSCQAGNGSKKKCCIVNTVRVQLKDQLNRWVARYNIGFN